jgi:membrane protein required for colicin V production
MIVIFDIVVMLLLGLAAWRGWKNGFIMEIFYMLFIFVSIYLSIHFSNWIATHWGGPPPNATGLKAFLGVMLLFCVALFFLAKLASVAIKAGGGGRVNSLAGLFFAVLKVAMTISVLLLVGEKINAKVQWMPREQKQASYTYEPLYRLSFLMLPALEESAVYQNGIKNANLLEGEE